MTASTRACTRLNMSHDGAHATGERVGPPGARGGAARATGPANRARDGDGSRHLARPAIRHGLRQRPRLGEETDGNASRPRGGAWAAAGATRARVADEANPAADLRVRSDGRARCADEPPDR